MTTLVETLKTTKIRATKIVLERAEGFPHECVRVTIERGASGGGNLWLEANRVLRGWAATVSPDGYDKVDLSVVYTDGDTYTGRMDIEHNGGDLDVAEHMCAILNAYALRKVPIRYANNTIARARWEHHILNERTALHREACKLLDNYEIGDD